MLEKIFDMGYCIEASRENDGRILLFVWPDSPLPDRLNRPLICSRYGKTLDDAISQAVEYLNGITPDASDRETTGA